MDVTLKFKSELNMPTICMMMMMVGGDGCDNNDDDDDGQYDDYD